MTRHWLRRAPGGREELGAALVAAGVAGVTYYLIRLFLARDPLPERPPARPGGDRRDDSGEDGPGGA